MIGKFSDINEQLLRKNIKEFLEQDFRNINENEIGKALSKCFFQDQSSERRYYNLFIVFSSKDKLFRVRKNISSLSEVIGDVNNFWCPPREIVREGRMNCDKEQVLYASLDKATAFSETGIKKDEKFLLIEYEIKENVELISIQMDERFGNNSLIAEIYNNFLNEIMIKNQEEKPGIYKVTNYLRNIFFRADKSDGWCYVSAQNNSFSNVALKYPEIESKIRIASVKIVELYDEKSYRIHEIKEFI